MGNQNGVGESYPYTLNRELSWLKFNQRVLEEAMSERNPLLEQLKFLSIFVSNLDEFYMIRVGSLLDQTLLDSMPVDNKSGMTAQEQLDAIFEATKPLYLLKDYTYRTLIRGLSTYSIGRVGIDQLDEQGKRFVEAYFKTELQPMLSPQIIDVHHPFPHLANKKLYVAAVLNKKNTSLYGLIPVNATFSRVVFLPQDGTRYVLAEDIILYYTERIFEIYHVTEKTVLCVTRNADIGIEQDFGDEDIDYRQYMKEILKKRSRLAAVRLEVYNGIGRELLNFLCQKLNLKEKQVFVSSSPLDLSYIGEIFGKIPEEQKRKLSFPSMMPYYPDYLKNRGSLLRSVEKEDVLLSYPYESIRPFLTIVREAAGDESVISIKITLYRIAKESKLAESLIMAAENGKDVTVVMELRARFDEQNNIEWANRLEKAGCRVIYGCGIYKVHSKICLIVRKEKGRFHYVTQVGTGNFNEKTAELYTDLALITANEEIGLDAVNFFKNIDLDNIDGEYRHLLVAPMSFKTRVMDLIEREMKKGREGRIIVKLNSITDKDVIDKLSSASQAGVKIDMIVRGICCIIPRIKELTENISVISIVGRFLEHSRVYIFGAGGDRVVYISSADFMTRNTERRVEIACPILDIRLADRIERLVLHALADNVKASDMLPDGNYVKRIAASDNEFNSQEFFIREARARSKEHAAKQPAIAGTGLRRYFDVRGLFIKKR